METVLLIAAYLACSFPATALVIWLEEKFRPKEFRMAKYTPGTVALLWPVALLHPLFCSVVPHAWSWCFYRLFPSCKPDTKMEELASELETFLGPSCD